MKKTLVPLLLLALSASFIFWIGRGTEDPPQLSGAFSFTGERSFSVAIETEASANKGGAVPLTYTSLQGVWQEKVLASDKQTQVVLFLFKPKKITINDNISSDASAFNHPILVYLNEGGKVKGYKFHPEVKADQRNLLKTLFSYRNIEIGDGKNWQASGMSEFGSIKSRYELEGNRLTQHFRSAEHDGYKAGSTILYKLNNLGIPESIHIDIKYQKTLADQRMQFGSKGYFKLLKSSADRFADFNREATERRMIDYKTVIDSEAKREIFIAQKPDLPQIDIIKAFANLDELILADDQTVRNSYFLALLEHFNAQPKDIERAAVYLLKLDASSHGYEEKVTLIISAMEHQISEAAENALIDMIKQATPQQSSILLQSAISLGSHLSPSLASLDALWDLFNRTGLTSPPRSAALMAIGRIAAHLPAPRTAKTQERLYSLANGSHRQKALMALSAMGNHGDKSYFGFLKEKATGDLDDEIRYEAIRSMIRSHEDNAIIFLKERALNDKNSRVREMAATAIAYLPANDENLEIARELYEKSSDSGVKQRTLAAIERFGQEKQDRTIEILQSILLRETDRELKTLVSRYIAKIRAP